MALKNIWILTLFPQQFDGFTQTSIIGKAVESNYININILDIRKFSNYKHKQVDDYQYGGGPGMVMLIEPIVEALKTIKAKNKYTILLTPQGKQYKQLLAKNISTNYDDLILISGHYEGVDERILNYIDEEISIGDYVLTGGELPAMVIADSVIRLIDGVINEESLQSESFNDNQFDHPVFSKPRSFEGHDVPEVLLSGHHENINKWRKLQASNKIKKNRPDLLKK